MRDVNDKIERSVVITGVGVVSPLGIGKDEFWKNLINGESGMDEISNFDAASYPSRIGAEVKEFDESEYLNKKEARYFSRAGKFACVAAELARRDATLSQKGLGEADVIIGSAVSSYEVSEKMLAQSLDENGDYTSGADPLAIMRGVMFAPAGAIAIHQESSGYVSMVSSACTSGLNALGLAASRIRTGLAEVSLAGAVDTPINKTIMGAFCAARFLSTDNENPREALRPMDYARTRLALGEGAAVFVLEEKERAIARGAKIYGEVLGFAQQTENANELFLIDKSGERWAETLGQALGEAADRRGGTIKIDHVSAHAPSDQDIDMVEYRALEMALGTDVSEIPAGSIKGAIGSPLAAAGAMQIAAAALTLESGEIPPTANHYIQDPAIKLDVKRVRRRQNHIRNVLVNSHGVGGVNTALVLGQVE